MDQQFDVLFRGDIVPGQSLPAVKSALAQLFKATDDRIDAMFSGKPVVIKSNVDEETAKRYQALMKKSGAVAQVRPSQAASSNNKPSVKNKPANDKPSQSVPKVPVVSANDSGDKAEIPKKRAAAYATYVVDTEAPEPLTEKPQETGASPDDEEDTVDFGFDLAPLGADVVEKAYQPKPVKREFDLSHLSLAEAGVNLVEAKYRPEEKVVQIDTSGFSLEQVEEDEPEADEAVG